MPPAVHPRTQRIYDRLPDLYRAADADQAGDLPFLRFLSLLGDQAGALEDLYDRINYVPPDEGGPEDGTSDLVDPARADGAWLTWLAQLVGITVARLTAERSYNATYGTLKLLYPTTAAQHAAAATYAALQALTATATGGDLSIAELRLLIANSGARWTAGSTGSVRDFVAGYLTGDKRVGIVRDVGGDPQRVTVYTYAGQTADPFELAAAFARADLAPAGTQVDVVTYPGATYGDLKAEFPTPAAMHATGMTYAQLHAYTPTY